MNQDLPKLRNRIYTERLTIPLEPEMKEALLRLKAHHRIDTSEWIRTLIREGVRSLAGKLESLKGN